MDRPSSILRKQGKPSFFKILINDFLYRLQIPPAFTMTFGKQIPNTTKLEVKDYHRKSWEVQVQKIGKIHFFSKGWREFVEENNLEQGDFLVFRYLADSKLFKVIIYGRTCCVKEFTVSRERNSELLNANSSQRNVQNEGKRRWVQEDDDDSNINQELKGARMIKSDFDGEKTYESKVIHIDSDEDMGTLKQTLCKRRTKEYCIEKNKTLKRGRKCNRLANDEDQIKFNSKNPFFKVQLKLSNISDTNSYLYIPRYFMGHLSKKKEQEARFHLRKGVWRLAISITNFHSNQARINFGWRSFVKDNGLKFGDVCFFEMMKSDDDDYGYDFKVHVYRKDGEKDEFVKIW